MSPRPLVRLRKFCLALPDAREVEAWGTSTDRFLIPPYMGPSGWIPTH